MDQKQALTLRTMLRTVAIFAVLLLVSCTLIYFGTRSDASTVAKSLKAGVLTADEVNTAFQNVGGRLIRRDIQESQHVKKDDVLMELDPTDTDIAIRRLEAVIASQKASIRLEEEGIRIASQNTDLTEKSSWRQIEQISAGLDAARAALRLAEAEYRRASGLVKTGSVSKSVFDSAVSGLTQARSAVTQSERQLNAAVIGATKAELARLAKTGSAEGMTLTAVKNARDEIANRQNTLAALRAGLAQSEADLDQLRVTKGRLTLHAPEDGTILKILYENGEMIAAGAPAVLIETDRRYFDIYVNETQAPRYPAGSIVTADVPALGVKVQGKVRFTTAAPSFADLRMTREHGQADLTAYKVRIYVEPAAGLLTGMTLEVNDAQHH